MDILQNIAWLVVAYLIGSVPTGYLISKRVCGIDIREHGSGNVGATNVFRVVGKKWGALVLAIDIFKGLLVTILVARTVGIFLDLSMPLKQLLFGAAAIAGHTWTPWLGLKGGKGVATSLGALLGIFPIATSIALLIWILCFVIWRYVSLASIVAALAYPVLLVLFYRTLESFPIIFVVSSLLVILLVYNHRNNIGRLRRGEELRFNFGKEKNP